MYMLQVIMCEFDLWQEEFFFFLSSPRLSLCWGGGQNKEMNVLLVLPSCVRTISPRDDMLDKDPGSLSLFYVQFCYCCLNFQSVLTALEPLKGTRNVFFFLFLKCVDGRISPQEVERRAQCEHTFIYSFSKHPLSAQDLYGILPRAVQDRNEKGMTFALAMYTRKRSRGWRTLAKKLFSGSLRALSLSRLEFNSDLF